jgi:hypothetical protein
VAPGRKRQRQSLVPLQKQRQQRSQLQKQLHAQRAQMIRRGDLESLQQESVPRLSFGAPQDIGGDDLRSEVREADESPLAPGDATAGSRDAITISAPVEGLGRKRPRVYALLVRGSGGRLEIVSCVDPTTERAERGVHLLEAILRHVFLDSQRARNLGESERRMLLGEVPTTTAERRRILSLLQVPTNEPIPVPGEESVSRHAMGEQPFEGAFIRLPDGTPVSVSLLWKPGRAGRPSPSGRDDPLTRIPEDVILAALRQAFLVEQRSGQALADGVASDDDEIKAATTATLAKLLFNALEQLGYPLDEPPTRYAMKLLRDRLNGSPRRRLLMPNMRDRQRYYDQNLSATGAPLDEVME